ncbi:hypothetical protein RMHFA_05680 [Roseomonas mucosa]|nr:hypothetical protein RMHFA_05680 [Roseomonas mucosa]
MLSAIGTISRNCCRRIVLRICVVSIFAISISIVAKAIENDSC